MPRPIKEILKWGLWLAIAGLVVAAILSAAALVIKERTLGIEAGVWMTYLYVILWPPSFALLANYSAFTIVLVLWLLNGILYGIVGLVAGLLNQLIKYSGVFFIAALLIIWSTFVTSF